MQNAEDAAEIKKAKRRVLAIKIGVWANVVFAFIGIPFPAFGAGAFLGSGMELIGLIKDKRLSSKGGYYALALFALTLGFLTASPWRDVGPITDDYTLADLTSADPAYDHTYGLLISSFYSKRDDPNGTPAIGLNREEVNFLRDLHQSKPDDLRGRKEWRGQLREDYFTMWDKTEEARKAVRRLAEYEQVADLAEPGYSENDLSTIDMRTLTYLYGNVVPLMIQDGRIEEGLDELIAWSTFIRKLSVTARRLVTKLVCYGMLSGCIETANEIANHPDINEQILERLQSNFPPLTQEQVSLQNPLIFEHLTQVNEFSVFKLIPFHKQMSSIRLLRNFTDEALARDKGLTQKKPTYTVWPFWLSFLPDIGTNIEVLPWYYWYYNPAGPMLTTLFHTPMENLFKMVINLQIRDDLLQYVLSYRLEGRADLTARAYGDAYIVDIEKKRIYSPGQIGRAHV